MMQLLSQRLQRLQRLSLLKKSEYYYLPLGRDAKALIAHCQVLEDVHMGAF